MATRTVPQIFPLLFLQESYTRRTVKASLWRKFAMAQNYIWSKHRRIYANGGVEGYGNRVFHLSSNVKYNADGGERQGAEDTPLYQGADISVVSDKFVKGVPIVTFIVPPNWCASTRLKVQVGYSYTISADSEAYIVASLQKLDGTFVAHDSLRLTGLTATSTWQGEVNVPQDGLYQMKIYLILKDSNTSTENSFSNEFIAATHVSARYAVANAAEMGGDTPPATWQPMADAFRAQFPVASMFLKRLTQNLQHLQAYRPPEICQVWLGQNFNNTSSFVEVGRYILWTPSRVTKWKGKLVIYSQGAGAGNEVRVLVNGVVKETFTALSAGENLKDIAEITVTDNQENTFTVEAKSTAAGAAWGTIVWGVQLWESGTTLGLPTGPSVATTVPANYKPLDELGLEGDDVITGEVNNAFNERAGLRTLFDNDRWLAFNRLRWLIGDWRGRRLKNAGFEDQDLVPDPRGSWTYGEATSYSGGYTGYDKFKNITIRGDDSADDDVDAIGGSNALGGTYDQGLPDSIDGDLLGPYTYPTDLQYILHGRRLGKWSAIRPTSVRTHLADLGGISVMMRARRLRPAEMSQDINGWGPELEERQYAGKAYLEFLLGSTVYRMPITPPGVTGQNLQGISPPPPDTIPSWLTPLRLTHSDADETFKVRGRLPSQPGFLNTPNYPAWQASHAYNAGQYVINGSPSKLYYCITSGTSAGAGGPTTTAADITDNTAHWRYIGGQYGRPEGMLFEVELLSWYIADDPLNPSLLLASPYT